MKKVMLLLLSLLMIGCNAQKNIDLSHVNYTIVSRDIKPKLEIRQEIHDKKFIKNVEDIINNIELKERQSSIKGGIEYNMYFYNNHGEEVFNIYINDTNLNINKEKYEIDKEISNQLIKLIEDNIKGS